MKKNKFSIFLFWFYILFVLGLIFVFIFKFDSLSDIFNKKNYSYFQIFIPFLLIIINWPILVKIYKEQKEINEKYIKKRDQFSPEERKIIDKKIGYIHFEEKNLYITLFVLILLAILLFVVKLPPIFVLLIIIFLLWFAFQRMTKGKE